MNLNDLAKDKVKGTRVAFTALYAKASPRFLDSRKDRVDAVDKHLQDVHDQLVGSIRRKHYDALFKVYQRLAPSINDKKKIAELKEQMAHIIKVIETPVQDLNIEAILSPAQFEGLTKWVDRHSSMSKVAVDTLAALCTQQKPDLGDGVFLNFFSMTLDPPSLEGASADLLEAWSQFRAAVAGHLKQIGTQKMAQVFPRELVPIAETIPKVQSIPAWEDAMTTQVSAAVALGSQVVGALRATVDGILNLWKLMPDIGEWYVEAQKSTGSKGKTTLINVKVAMDAMIVTIYLATAHLELAPSKSKIDALHQWKFKLGAVERPNLAKEITEALVMTKCNCDAAQICEACSRLAGVGTRSSVAVSAHTMMGEAFKNLGKKNIAKLISMVNDITIHVKRSLVSAMARLSAHECCLSIELEKLCAEGGKLNDEMTGQLAKAGQHPECKQLFQDFRFWNEHIISIHCNAKELAPEGVNVEAWDLAEEVQEVGKLCGSMTLLQGLLSPAGSRVENLTKAMKGLAVLGRGLMDGHSVVQARVNEVLAEGAAAAAAAAAVAQTPASKKLKASKAVATAVATAVTK